MPTTTVILGGGFGGIATATALKHRLGSDHRVVLIDKQERFTVGAGMTWVAIGESRPDEVSRPLAALADQGIEYRREEVLSIDAAGKKVRTSTGELAADFLVIALGAEVNLGGVPGLESAHTFYTLAGAERLRDELGRFKGGRVVLLIPRMPFKCPPAPYEGALLLKSKLPSADVSVHTVEPAPMGTAGPDAGKMVKGLLEKAGIGFFPNRKAARVDIARQAVVFEDGSEAAYDLLVAVPPHSAPKAVKEAGLVNEAGWIPVDSKTLRTKHPNVFAIGDVAAVPLPGRFKPDVPLSLPKAGIFAGKQGAIVADQIAAQVTGGSSQAAFDGVGFCYVEAGHRKAIRADGDFFREPHPWMSGGEPTEAALDDKKRWVKGWLDTVKPA